MKPNITILNEFLKFLGRKNISVIREAPVDRRRLTVRTPDGKGYRFFMGILTADYRPNLWRVRNLVKGRIGN